MAVPSDVCRPSTVTVSRLGADSDTSNVIHVSSSEPCTSDTLTVGVPSGAMVLNSTVASFVVHVLSLYAVYS